MEAYVHQIAPLYLHVSVFKAIQEMFVSHELITVRHTHAKMEEHAYQIQMVIVVFARHLLLVKIVYHLWVFYILFLSLWLEMKSPKS